MICLGTAALAAAIVGWAAVPRAGAADAPSAAADAPATPVAADSVAAPATLRVYSSPSGLQVLIDSVLVGRTPLESLQVPPGTVRVRVLPSDPRRFDPARDALSVTLRPGATVSVFLDVRLSVVLRSNPEPVSVTLTGRAGSSPDTLLGETPLSVRPAAIEVGLLRFTRPAFADTTLAGSAFLADSMPAPRVTLRRVPTLAAPPPALSSNPPLYRKRWFQWSLIGAGVVLSGAAVALHHQGDDWYDAYLSSSDVSEIDTLYDRAARCDRWAAASLVVGQVCLVGGLVLLITGQSP